MKTVAATIALLAGSASLALANCPVAADLADGIYITYDDDSVTHYSGTPGGLVLERTTYLDDSGEFYDVPVVSGLFSTGYVDGKDGAVIENTRENLTYETEIESFLPVTAGQSFTVNRTRAYTDGTASEKERYVVVVGQETSARIGECTFTALPVTHTIIDSKGVRALTQTYLPELGIATYDGYSEAGGESYSYMALEISNWAPAN